MNSHHLPGGGRAGPAAGPGPEGETDRQDAVVEEGAGEKEAGSDHRPAAGDHHLVPHQVGTVQEPAKVDPACLPCLLQEDDRSVELLLAAARPPETAGEE